MRALFSFVVAALWPVPALACSPAEGEFDTPSNFELVQRADLIVLGRIVGPSASVEDVPGALALEPIEVLKGELPDEPLVVPGQLGWGDRSVAPIVTPLVENHFSAGMGACVRLFYQPGELVIALLEGNPETTDDESRLPRYLPRGDPSSRSIETVAGPDDIWVQAVRLYIEIGSGSGDPTTRLAETRDAMRSRGDFAGSAIANDLGWVLSNEEASAYWDAFNLPDGAVAYLRDPVAQEQVVLVCAKEEGGVRLIASRGSTFDLTIGESAFTSGETQEREVPGGPADPESHRLLSSSFADQATIMSRLAERHEAVGLRIDGQEFASAPPGDVLLRWSQRCGAILESEQ